MFYQEKVKRFVSALFRGVLRRQSERIRLGAYVRGFLRGTTRVSPADEFPTSEEPRAKTAVKLFVPPGHFYSPIVDPTEADRHLAALEATPTRGSINGINLDRAEMVRIWHILLPFLTSVPFDDVKDASRLHYCFDNPHYSWGDGSILHAFIRHFRPKRLIEIGSGWSSACALDTVEQYLCNDCELIFIEPHPALLLDLLKEAAARVRILDTPVQQVPLSLFEQLRAGDIVFIDSTHVLRTGSDVCFELFEILPRLGSGVVVHFHDMFWPFEYPRLWSVEENRSWNELYAVRAYLLQNYTWRIIFFNDYFAKLERPLIEATYPRFLRNTGGALWLQRI
jgi:hypothetical protein